MSSSSSLTKHTTINLSRSSRRALSIPWPKDVAPAERGVYAVYYKGQLVYAGKALQTRLNRRLAEHYRKIVSRQNIDVTDVTCRYLVIRGDWFVRAAEDALIQTYKPVRKSVRSGSNSAPVR